MQLKKMTAKCLAVKENVNCRILCVYRRKSIHILKAYNNVSIHETTNETRMLK